MMRHFIRLATTLLLIALLAACHSAPVAPMPDDAMRAALPGGRWLLTEIAGQKIKTNAERLAYLEFSADNRVWGSGGCNRLTGTYHFDSGQLHFSRMISTKMACIDMRTENALLAALSTVTTSALSDGGNILTLYDNDGAPRAAFRRDASGVKQKS